ncbi:OLC1v1005554C1 [Oldenlandia corymbosa var. corymbosa]|uniref:OLC1v1005554C1 n=1 Tax=Oldenlandia corymbosa var. corymbosa TaxID=529605 RepID=A0AAV1DEW5_OLDCO|nr:OLC1v1005554C1 [Oldenlandia corymbosa var. corymbosa]
MVESQTPVAETLLAETQVAKTLVAEAQAAETPTVEVVRSEGSSSGLTDKEKSVVIVDVPSEIVLVTTVFNSFAALATIEEAATEVVDGDGEELVENVYIEDPPPRNQI